MRIDINDGLDLASTIAYALTLIDTAAGEARARYITVAPGQETTYQLKADEAQRYLDAGAPSPVDPAVYPFIAGEAFATGKSPNVAAGVILGTRDVWVDKAAQIETVRMRGKTLVSKAVTWFDCITARDTAIDQLKSL